MKNEKLRKRIMSNPPKRDITPDELDTFLKNNDFELIRNANSSHPMYRHTKFTKLVVGFGNPHPKKEVLVCYVRNIQKVIEELNDLNK